MKGRATYGIDAPGVVLAHVVLGGILAAIASTGFSGPEPSPIPASLNVGAAFVSALLLFGAAVMLRSSLVSKKRVSERLVAALALSGSERVLDAGCGRGLSLIGCAKNSPPARQSASICGPRRTFRRTIQKRPSPMRQRKA